MYSAKRVFLIASLTTCGPALAAETVFGPSSAQLCYEYATAGTPSARQAVETCTEAIKNESLSHRDLAASYSNRGMLQALRGRPEDAIADYDRALALDPALTHAIINRANSLTRLRRFDEALHDYDLASFYSEGRNALVFYNRSMLHLQMNRPQAARRDLLRALELQPDSLRYREALASLQ